VRALAGGFRPWPVASVAVVLGALALLVLPLLAGAPVNVAAVLAAAVVFIVAARKTVFRWPSLLTLLILVIWFIPIRRYVLPGSLPFQLEPYRLLIAILTLIWLSALLIDPRVRLRRTGFEGPIALYLVAVLGSVVFNNSRIGAENLNANVIKSLTFLFAFVIVLYLFVSVIRREDEALRLMKVLVVGAAVVAGFAMIESRTGFNVFNHLNQFIPFLKRDYSLGLPLRNGRFRATGPAEHAIALSAALAMLVPFAIYFAYTLRKWVWWLVAAVILFGCLSTVSRTGVLMLLVEGVVFVILRPRQTLRFWPALIPLVLAVHIALPGTLGTLRAQFFPKGGLIKQQQGFEDTGRFGKARLDPTFADINRHPLFGIGYGTRILVSGAETNAKVLDDQWLDNVLDTGIVGAFAWVWLLVRAVRGLGAAAKRDQSERGWLLVALAAPIAAFGISMLTYDTFSFIQVTLLFYLLLAFASIFCLREEFAKAPVAARQLSTRPASLQPIGIGLILFAIAILLFVFVQGTSIGFLSFILILIAFGSWAAERTLNRGRVVS
jgi:O-antigen ligase/polysaccharide polymerase Wzy-like membrane protein